jgi:hypothetical protein
MCPPPTILIIVLRFPDSMYLHPFHGGFRILGIYGEKG